MFNAALPTQMRFVEKAFNLISSLHLNLNIQSIENFS